jgi:hypothetical protein
MNNLNKIQRAIESDILAEKIVEALLTRKQRVTIFLYRYRIQGIQRKCSTMVHSWYPGKESVSKLLLNRLGDFSGFEARTNPEPRQCMLANAEKLLMREFDILGSGETKLEKIDWHTDFVSGYRWAPGTFYKDYQQVNLENTADVKIPRELSRCHHFLLLGQAYLLTEDERYADEFVEQILDWIDSNPLMKSVNWGCTMDVAIRAVNWVWALGMFIGSNALTDAVLKRIFVSLYEHGFFIYRNPERNVATNQNHNHYLSDLVGQIYLGVLFSGMQESSVWLTKGRNEFFREMRSQILPSGPTYERSVNYHRLVVELCSSAVLLLRKNSIEIPSDIWYRLEKMYEFVMHYIKPDGLAPVIGDQDEGRVHPFGIQKNTDHRYLLSVGAAMFHRSDFKKHSNGYNPDCFFLLGSASKAAFDRIGACQDELRSHAFPDAGFYVMRSDGHYMFVNSSGKGLYHEHLGGTHTHSDLLSFELAANGKTFLIDPGSYLYSANPKERLRFRSTAMHNTVTIDGENQNNLAEDNLWNFERNAIPEIICWKSNVDFDVFEGSHSGYQRLADPVTHSRKIVFDKKDESWEIEDLLAGTGEHLIELHFHFDEGIDFELGEKLVTTTCADGRNIRLLFDSQENFELEKRSSWVSKHYGVRTESKVLVVTLTARCPAKIRTTIETVELS